MRPTALAALAILSLVLAATAGDGPAAEKRSSFDGMAPEIQAMQRDDGANPGMLWVRDGADLWASPPASGRPACAGCHGEAATTMRGVAARYPAWDARTAAPLDLEGRIDQCRTVHQGETPLPREGAELLGLTAFVALQSRGQPLASPDDPRLAPARAAGATLFTTRMGQLGLSCAACHDDNAGRRLGGATIPQGHANGYPLYRLEWQGLGSVQRRLRNCLSGMRAEPFPYGAPEYTALELHLAQRSAPLPMEAPAVRP